MSGSRRRSQGLQHYEPTGMSALSASKNWIKFRLPRSWAFEVNVHCRVYAEMLCDVDGTYRSYGPRKNGWHQCSRVEKNGTTATERKRIRSLVMQIFNESDGGPWMQKGRARIWVESWVERQWQRGHLPNQHLIQIYWFQTRSVPGWELTRPWAEFPVQFGAAGARLYHKVRTVDDTLTIATWLGGRVARCIVLFSSRSCHSNGSSVYCIV
jgi:hypothetical protein